jgi:hypothetical protein
VDFWAQHKDFVLRVLAGFGVFLVALIVRGMVYGDDLENETNRNSTLQREITSYQLAEDGKVPALRNDAEKLHANTLKLVEQIAWNTGAADLERTLLRRIFGYTRTYRDGGDAALDGVVQQAETALQGDVNAGFGQLRLKVRPARSLRP